MKRILIVIVFAAALVSCGTEAAYVKASDAQEAAREFVRASLDGNYDKANFYLFKDSAGTNEMLLSKWRDDYNKWSQEDKVGHKNANIIVINTEPLKDSALNFIYSNSYKKDTTTIKIVKEKGDWLIDLKDIH